MQHQQASPSASPASLQAASVSAVPSTEPSVAPAVAGCAESMDVSANETPEGVRDLEIESNGDGDEDEEDAAMREDEDDSDSDSDYDFDKDLEEFDEEDDNDELDEDERFHYFESLKTEIEEYTEETERDFYVRNMLAQRDRLTGEEAEWVDKFIKEQAAWKEKNKGQSVDTYGNIVKLAKFIPQTLSRKRPARATPRACLLAGADTGTCTDPADFDVLIPFCKAVVPYTACLPRYQSLWYNHSALSKDKFIEQMFSKLVTQRKQYETNETFLDKNTDEWGGPREIVPRFVENPDCENAFRNYFCWLNFPRCDAEGRSLLLCRSVCENYMKACQLSKDLWRCGEPKFVNGREPETSVTWINKTLVYYRAPFPGSPFKDNVVNPDTNKPLVVCTPSLENAARTSDAPASLGLFAASALLLTLLLV